MKRAEKVELARTLYFKTDKTQKEICAIVSWSENTFTRYKAKEYWDEQKAANILTNDMIISELRIQAKMITDESKKKQKVLTASEVDSISKIASSIEKLSSKVGISTMIESAMKFIEWIRLSGDLEKATEVSDLLDAFIKDTIIKRD